MRGIAVAAAAALAALMPMSAAAEAMPPARFNLAVELRNFSITAQREKIYNTPQYLENGCAGDIRLDNWATNGYGLVKPVLFTARDGATISGHVWATAAGPAKRPGVVITDGSVQADQQMYWYLAQTLAKEGYVVLTFDPQGQGQSDTLGQGPDTLEGVPAQTSGTPFYDGTEDAIDFFLSTPSQPYEPVRSCRTGTSHATKQNQRVTEGFDAVSYIAQWDPRVKAVVALDNLGVPKASDEAPCPADPADRATVPITKPGLGISADYGLPPTPNLSLPNPRYECPRATRCCSASAGATTRPRPRSTPATTETRSRSTTTRGSTST